MFRPNSQGAVPSILSKSQFYTLGGGDFSYFYYTQIKIITEFLLLKHRKNFEKKKDIWNNILCSKNHVHYELI